MDDKIKNSDNILQSAVSQINEQERKKKKSKRRKKQEDVNPFASFDIPGVTKIIISPMVQKEIQCSVGEDVTAQNPWKYVSKEMLEDSLQLQKSEFLPIKEELLNYPRPELLLGYLPEDDREYDEFFICLTEPAKEAVSEIISEIRKLQEEKLNNSIFKKPSSWKSQGSEPDIELLISKNNRPLLELEIETQYPIVSTKSHFRFRFVEDVRDGYVELLPGRIDYMNIPRKRIDANVQITPSVNSNEAQTICTYPKHVWTQYEYEYETVTELSEEIQENMQKFLSKNIDRIDDMILVNSDINFYKNDYANIVKDERSTRIVDITNIKEFISFMDMKTCKGKVISRVAWHPTWTGTLAIAYSEEAPSVYKKIQPDQDEVIKALYEVTPILLWSFMDSLYPKLLLETHREVTEISFCPFYEDLLVGGCVNGQIIIWDIKGELENLDKEDLRTPVQQEYRNLMYLMMKWTNNAKEMRTTRYAAISDLVYSHKDAVTEIKWISPYRQISKSGQIKDIPEKENRTSLQFITTSKDGTVLCWDLKTGPVIRIDSCKHSRKQRRLKQLPSALLVEESPFRSLHKTLRPIFKVDVFVPGTNRNLPLTTSSIRITPFIYKKTHLVYSYKTNIAQRIHYEPILTKPTQPLVNQFIAGTVEGNFLIASWEGLDLYDYDPEEILSKQTCKFDNFSKFHDGPVISLSRTEEFPDLILTVGGKVFALWKMNFIGKPILWRRSKYRYTHGIWNAYRPSIFRLTREDGCVEIWHLKVRSDRYEELQPISAGALIGTYMHPINFNQNLMGVADSNSSFRLFHISQHLTQIEEDDKQVLDEICSREVERKLLFVKWQEQWKQTNAQWLKMKQTQERQLQQEKETELKRKKREMEELQKKREKEETTRLALLAKPAPGKLAEWADWQWRENERKRLGKILLAKKGLDREFLEKQQLPLTQVIQEEANKKKKQEERLGNSEKIFKSTIAAVFAEAIEKKPPPTPDPYVEGDPPSSKRAYYEDYLEMEKQCEEFIHHNRYVHHIDWHKLWREGKERRKLLDEFYNRRSHKNRLLIKKK